MEECGMFRLGQNCKIKINNSDCPGQINGMCVSSVYGGGENTPPVCNKRYKSHRCLEICPDKCPGKKEDCCVSIHERKILPIPKTA